MRDGGRSSESCSSGPSTADILSVPDTFQPMFGFYQRHLRCWVKIIWDIHNVSCAGTTGTALINRQINREMHHAQLVLGKLSQRFCIPNCSKVGPHLVTNPA